MPSTDVEANAPAPCCTAPRFNRRSVLRKAATSLVILSVLLVCDRVLDPGEISMTSGTCPVRGPPVPKLVRMGREFRRRFLKRVNIQDLLFEEGLQEPRQEQAGDHASAVKKHDFGIQKTLQITVVSATDLHATRWWDPTDPYVVCVLVGNEDSKFETPHKKDELHPVWNFEHEVDYAGEDLTCKVWDVNWHRDEEIAHVTISSALLEQGWDLMKDFPLEPSGWARKHMAKDATLRLKLHLESHAVDIGDDEPPPEPTPKDPFWWACDTRVRKDWIDLTPAEKKLYLAAVNALKTTPREGATGAGPGNNIYDTFVMIHEQGENKAYAHQTAGFLAWHRKYLLEYESALRSVDEKYRCVTLPYWDWTSETFGCKSVWSGGTALDTEGCDTYHAASQLLTDFGGPGDPTQTENTHGSSGSGPVGCVTSGPFAGWVDHHGKCLSRGVNWKISAQKPFVGRIEMLKILNYPEYGNQRDREGFRVVLEGIPHGATHNYLGGHMRSFISPADPIFFSHHGYIDKLWAVWQDCHDYDTPEVHTALLSQSADSTENFKFYEPTKGYKRDSVVDTMLFKLKFAPDIGGTAMCPTGGSECTKAVPACGACVAKHDGWCRANAWDHTCCSMCAELECAAACGAQTPADVDMHAEGPTYLKDWVVSETTPAHVWSVHSMSGDGRSYRYAHDEIEKNLQEMNLPTCKIKHSSFIQTEVHQEIKRLHHNRTRRGYMARTYAEMVAKSFADAKKQMEQEGKSSSEHRQEHFERAMKVAQAEECERMASKCEGDYKREYNCKADQPRFFLPWMGTEQWHEIMGNDSLKHKVFQDPCCAGDEESLEPGALP